MRIILPVMLGLALLPASSAGRADEREVPLVKAPGVETVETNCNVCHSLDYIRTNAPFPTKAVWEAEVTKMIKAFGAPVSDADAKTIVDYLAANYGS